MKTHSPELGRESTIKEHNRKVIMNSNTLLLTALGVIFCSGCTTKQRLERLGATVEVNEQGEIVEVDLSFTQITDAGLVHLAGLTSPQDLNLYGTQITDAGLVHLEGLTSLQTLHLFNTQITDAGLAKLRETLPNCQIYH